MQAPLKDIQGMPQETQETTRNYKKNIMLNKT